MPDSVSLASALTVTSILSPTDAVWGFTTKFPEIFGAFLSILEITTSIFPFLPSALLIFKVSEVFSLYVFEICFLFSDNCQFPSGTTNSVEELIVTITESFVQSFLS